jgi:G3E family GTPase
MPAEPSPFCREASLLDTPRHCVFVTGPRGAGKTRELQLQVHDLAEQQPGARCAVLLAEEGRTRMEGFAQGTPGVAVRRLLLPCTCCPALADLPGALRALVAAARPDWLFAEVPALAAAGLVAEFARACGWPRELVVCLDRVWATHQREHASSPFQMVLLELADRVVSNPARGGIPRGLDMRSGRPNRPAAALVLT